jgi:hypothetical protein
VRKKSKVSACKKFYNCLCCKRRDRNSLDNIVFSRAPEPTDVFWEHLGFTESEKRLKTFYSYIVMLVTIGISLGVIYGLSIVKSKNQDASMKDTIISIIISLVICLVNFIVSLVARFISLSEYNTT